MRSTFVKTLSGLARVNKDVYLLTGDLGFKLFDDFREEFPERFINMGVAEQNMVGVASGLSLAGKNVYCYSMIPFLTLRTLEFIKVDICYQNLNVKLIGVGCGVTYGFEGITHHAIEDIAVMRALPNITVVAPGDPLEARTIIEQSLNYEGPLYVRLGGNNDPVVHRDRSHLTIGKGAVVQEGSDLVLVATGTALPIAKQAAALLENYGIKASLVSMHTVSPLDTDIIVDYATKCSCIVSVEEHGMVGGLGSAIAEKLLELRYGGQFIKIGLPHRYGGLVGSAAYLRKAWGLTPEGICQRVIERIGHG